MCLPVRRQASEYHTDQRHHMHVQPLRAAPDHHQPVGIDREPFGGKRPVVPVSARPQVRHG